MIKKVLVANRGEIAMRIFRTCRVMNIPTVAIYTHVDRGALHVRYAEEAYCISEDEADTSYLKPDLILEIAKKTGAAIHPGYGFLSENADFARRCEEEGVIFIGPSADVIAKMGIKTEAERSRCAGCTRNGKAGDGHRGCQESSRRGGLSDYAKGACRRRWKGYAFGT